MANDVKAMALPPRRQERQMVTEFMPGDFVQIGNVNVKAGKAMMRGVFQGLMQGSMPADLSAVTARVDALEQVAGPQSQAITALQQADAAFATQQTAQDNRIKALEDRVTALEGRAPIVKAVDVPYQTFLAIGRQVRTVNVAGLKKDDSCFINRTGGVDTVQIVECHCLTDGVLTVIVAAFALLGTAGTIPAKLTIIR